MRHARHGAGPVTLAAMVLAFVSPAPALLAHDTWLLPERFRVAPSTTLALRLTSGMAFPRNESAVKADRLVVRGARVADSASTLTPGAAQGGALVLRARLETSGVAMLWVQSRPRSLDLTPPQVREYLEEIGAPEAVGRRWEAAGRGRWRESYVKCAKSYVRVGEPGDDRSWTLPAALPLEIMPEADPTSIRAGAPFAVRVLLNGAPLPDLTVTAVSAGAKHVARKTDAQGRVELTPAAAGPWLLKATRIVEATDGTHDWQSQFTTMTVEVSAAR